MTMDATDLPTKEPTIFTHIGNKIITEDREIKIIARLEEPLIVILGNVLSDEECDELISLSKDKINRSKISNARVDNMRTSSSTFLEESENIIVSSVRDLGHTKNGRMK